MDLVGAATSARDAVRLFSESRPGVVLMDLDLPNSAGIHSVREIRELDPAACIIGLFTYPWDDSGNLARDAGAQTCIAKDRLHQDLVEVIRSCWHKHLGEL